MALSIVQYILWKVHGKGELIAFGAVNFMLLAFLFNSWISFIAVG
jgi:hypothetical protein